MAINRSDNPPVGNESADHTQALQLELLQEILEQLHILNLHMSFTTDQDITTEDL